MTKWLINGADDDRVAVGDRGLAYGDGLFETIAVRNGRLRFFDFHLDRMLDGADRLKIPAPARELFIAEALGLVSRCDYGTLKIILTRGAGLRGYSPPDDPEPMRILGLLPGVQPATKNYTDGIVARHCSTPIGRSPATAGLKTLGRLEQVLARAEWRNASIAEGLMSTTDGFVVCGTMSNLFLVQDRILIVPDLATCGINGVMRRVVINTADKIGLQWRVEDVPRDALRNADELFVSNSLIGVWPIRRVDDHVYSVGSVTRGLMSELADAGVSECAGE